MVQAYGRFGGWDKIGAFAKNVWETVGDEVLDFASSKIEQAGQSGTSAAPASAPTSAPASSGGGGVLAQQRLQAQAQRQAQAQASASGGLPGWLLPVGLVVAVALIARGR